MKDSEKSEQPEECDPELARFAKQGGGAREVLQAVEDALVDAGFDDFVVATQRGTFHWQTVARARTDAAKREDEGNTPNA